MSSRVKLIIDAFTKLNCIFLSIFHIENIRKTQYDAKNPWHEQKLLKVNRIIILFFIIMYIIKIWTLLRPEKTLTGRYTTDWSKIKQIKYFEFLYINLKLKLGSKVVILLLIFEEQVKFQDYLLIFKEKILRLLRFGEFIVIFNNFFVKFTYFFELFR